jgi:hypothetical protein
VYQATKTGLHVVYSQWLDKSAALWKRQDEAEYSMVETLKGTSDGSKSGTGTPAQSEPKEEAPEAVPLVATKDVPTSQGEGGNVGREATPDLLEGAAGEDEDWDKWMRDELGDEWEDEASERGR